MTFAFTVSAEAQQNNNDGPPQAVTRRPQFTIASAAAEIKLPEGAPVWRHVLGNLAAGATAGCAVEAGMGLASSCGSQHC